MLHSGTPKLINTADQQEEFIGDGFPFDELPSELFQKIIEFVPESVHDLRLVSSFTFHLSCFFFYIFKV